MYNTNSNLFSGQQFWGRNVNRVVSFRRSMTNIFAYCCPSKPDERGYEGVVEYFYDADGKEKPVEKPAEESTDQPTVAENDSFKVTVRKYSHVGITIH